MRSTVQTRGEVTPAPELVRQRLHARRWSIMVRYPIWDDDWIKLLLGADAAILLQIFEATRRLERGTYGCCVGCAGHIDARRLLEMPETPICAVCETFRESGAPSGTLVPAP